jgi:hypothetical protein
MYWVRMPKVLPGKAGMHRWVWDLRYAPPPTSQHEYPISAVFHDTPAYPLGTSVMPGNYTVKLTAGGKTMTQTFAVKMDPRVKTAAAGLTSQFQLSRQVCELMQLGWGAMAEIAEFRHKLNDPASEMDRRAAAIQGAGGGGRRGGRGGGAETENLMRLNGELVSLLGVLDSADAAPTSQAAAAVADLARATAAQLKAWKELTASAAK